MFYLKNPNTMDNFFEKMYGYLTKIGNIKTVPTKQKINQKQIAKQYNRLKGKSITPTITIKHIWCNGKVVKITSNEGYNLEVSKDFFDAYISENNL